jgi:hypothetical protein
MKKRLVTFALIILALGGLILLASVPDFSTKAKGENFWSKTEDEITIDKTVHDFGTVKENGGSISAIFTITNNTRAPIVITYVSASCGCTVPSWTKEPVEPGNVGIVTATYNPLGRPGPFDKSITILTNGNPERIIARIKGTVEK